MYRDTMARCPRCGSELVDAAAARACSECSGLWISIESLTEMTTEMQMPVRPVPLLADVDKRQPLACPECTEPMQTLLMYSLQIDMCFKRHGVWFDAEELGMMLLRSVIKPVG